MKRTITIAAWALLAFASGSLPAADNAQFTPVQSDSVVLDEPAAPPRSATPELVGILILGLGLGAWVSRGLARLRWKLPEPRPNAPVGLGGWMVLPVLGVVGTPLFLLYSISVWLRNVTTTEHLGAGIHALVAVEFLTVSALLAISLFCIFLMIARYRTFPYAFIFLQALGIALLLMDSVLLALLRDADLATEGPSFGKVVLRVLIVGLWSWYMIESERVRATFVDIWDGVEAPGTRVVPAN